MANGWPSTHPSPPVGEREKIVVEAEEILFALGRVPNIMRLDVENAGVAAPLGAILTDALMQTNQPHIYAVGDCTGPYEIVHIAIQQGAVIFERRAEASFGEITNIRTIG